MTAERIELAVTVNRIDLDTHAPQQAGDLRYAVHATGLYGTELVLHNVIAPTARRLLGRDLAVIVTIPEETP